MARLHWIAGSVLKAEDLEQERADLASRQALHEQNAHCVLEGAPAAAGARVRSVDGTVSLSMPAIEALSAPTTDAEALSAPTTDARAMLRGWAISAGREVLSLDWGAGSRALTRLRGALACKSLKCTAVELAQPISEPTAAQPFRLFRRAANPQEKKPEALVIELAAPADPEAAKTNPPPGLQIGAKLSQGFVPLLEVRPGRGVVIHGKEPAARKIFRGPPAEGPSDAALVRAFLRTEAGKAARAEIEKKRDKVTLTLNSPAIHPGALVNFDWSVTNGTDMKLKNLRALATIMPPSAGAAPVWTEQAPPSSSSAPNEPTTTLDVGERATGKGELLVPAEGTKLVLLLAMEADYGVPITKLAPS